MADLVLLGTVAIVNVNTVPPVARFGRLTLVLWAVAWATFFVPTAIAVLTLAEASCSRPTVRITDAAAGDVAPKLARQMP